MEQITMGNVCISRVVAGFARLKAERTSPDELRRFVDKCLDMGVNTMDNADIYGGYTAEAYFGDSVLAGNPGLRSRLKLITKFGNVLPQRFQNPIYYYESSAAHIRQSCDNSLRNLHTDHIDLYLHHRPNPLLDPAETADAIAALIRDGKITAFGVSNYTPAQFEMLQSYLGDIPIVTNEVPISLKNPAVLFDGTADLALKRRIPLLAYSPLAGGRLFDAEDADSLRLMGKVREKAEKYGVSADQILYAFLFRHPTAICPITGTLRAERVDVAVQAASLRLESCDWFELLEASRGYNVP